MFPFFLLTTAVKQDFLPCFGHILIWFNTKRSTRRRVCSLFQSAFSMKIHFIHWFYSNQTVLNIVLTTNQVYSLMLIWTRTSCWAAWLWKSQKWMRSLCIARGCWHAAHPEGFIYPLCVFQQHMELKLQLFYIERRILNMRKLKPGPAAFFLVALPKKSLKWLYNF